MNRLILAVVFFLTGVATGLAEEPRIIVTTGVGTVEAEPDMATVRVGVTREARLAGDALDQTSKAMADVIARLQQEGVAARDMQTQGLSLQPVWSRQNSNSNEQRRITGFLARNGLIVRVRALDDLGSILDQIVQDGANTFDGVSFALQEPEAALAEARERAVIQAMEKAEQLTLAAGVGLGPVMSIAEVSGVPRPAMMEMAAVRMTDAVPIATGEVSLSVQVEMEFEIVDE